jgi:hypothetical protein
MISARINPSCPRRLRVATAIVVCVVSLAAWACSLNPQPIPPGFSENGDTDAGLRMDGATGPFNGLDGAGGGNPDADAPSSLDAGDAGEDAADASSDAPSDAGDGGD